MWRILIALAIPLLEIGLFIQVGGWIGVWPVLGLVFVAAVAGVMILRMTGGQAVRALQGAVARREDPGQTLVIGALRLIAAGLLIVPGFLTDALALILLIPQVQQTIFVRIKFRMSELRPDGRPRRSGDDVIDGSFEEMDEADSGRPKLPTHEPSGWTRH